MSAPIMGILSLSINTAKRAGVLIRDILKKGDLAIVDKGEDDLQTEADRTAQRCIVASLAKKFPNIHIIGEEGETDLNIPSELLVTELDQDFLKNKCPEDYTEVKSEDIVVWVDPLDGTSEFTEGLLEHVTVLIGVAVKNEAVGGVIHQPYYEQSNGELGRTVWGLKGLGIGGLALQTPPEGKFIVTTSRSHVKPLVQAALEAVAPTEVLRVGGAGYKVLQLLDGKAHAYLYASPGCKRWDTCAPEAILEAAGGILTDVLGDHYEYHRNVEFLNKRGVLATFARPLHKDLVSKIPTSVKDVLSN